MKLAAGRRISPSSAGEARALLRLQDGAALGDVIDGLAAKGVDPDTALVWFGRWMHAGMIAGVDREETKTTDEHR